jgi:prepilin peptidase CpaA
MMRLGCFETHFGCGKLEQLMEVLFPARVLLIAIVLVAAVCDIRSRKIPNWLTLPGVLAGLAVNGIMSGWPGLKTSAMGLGLAFGLYFVLYALRAMGAGDVKLMAAVGSIVGPWPWMQIFVASAIAGGVSAIILMAVKGKMRETLGNTGFIIQELMHFRAPYAGNRQLDVKNPDALKLPHGVAIATGTIAALLYTAR